MTRKIFRYILFSATAVVLLSMFIIMGVLYEYFTTIQTTALREWTQLAAQGVESGGMDYLTSVEDMTSRVTWVDSDGSVIYDSQADARTMENHAGREEIELAFSEGTGESSRHSQTLTEMTFYRAQRLSDGTVVRLSITRNSILALALGMAGPISLVFILAVILSAAMAGRLSKRIVKPLNSLDLDNPLENDVYEELTPLLSRIESQHRRIDKQLVEIKSRQEEFDAVTGSMKEGLVLLNDKGFILSINPAAMSIFAADGKCVGEDFMTLERSRDVSSAIRTALDQGHGEARLERAGREYQLNASRVGDAASPSGIAILVFDVTEMVSAEKNRREFTANVSHELKTPLQSIMGSAELLENGMVKVEDIPRFTGRIRDEAARLVALIDDIIRLSRLDEGGEMPEERFDLGEIALQCAKSLEDSAGSKGVEVTVDVQSAYITGVKRLVQEIAFNLVDNAIKYNREGGNVTVRVLENEKGASLVVSDTGIGIPPEHQQRVFERFYRVDKSRSKKTCGTGLGLSIVKHAAQYLSAEIHLESATGEGTRIEVLFPHIRHTQGR
ncbi:MAG: ATP-binding protein [Clostridia bacterium]|nr:ATP-binding protein [Clostridia bacterium]